MAEPVKCSRCGTNNEPANTYCIKCGALLQSTPGDSQSFDVEIRRLRGMVSQINARLDVLENSQQGAATPPPQPELKGEQARPVEPAVGIKPEIPAEHVTVYGPATVPAEQKPAGLKAIPALPQKETEPKKEPAPKKEWEWEQILGSNWLARIGILALIIGIGFFLKYAFDNNWIGPAARVILGGCAGLVMLGLGFYWRKRYPVLTQVLSGGGIAVFYLSIFASSSTYNLINIYIATVLLLAVSILATLLALRYNSIALSIIGIFGAYFAPFILGAFSEGTYGARNTSQASFLMIYIVIIGLGVLTLSAFRNWRWFTLLSLACSLITYGFWYSEFHRIVSVAAAEISITAIFLIFVSATSLFHIIQKKVPAAFDYILVSLNAAAYTGISLGIMWDEYRGWIGGFIFLLAVFYGLLSFFLARCSKKNTTLSRFSLFLGLVFLTAAIPVQFRDSIWTPILFAVEMVAMASFSVSLKMPSLRYFSYVVFITMVWDLLIAHTDVNTRDFTAVINERFLVYIIGIAATYMTFVFLRTRRQNIPEWLFTAVYLLLITNFITLWLISFEIWGSFAGAINSAGMQDINSLIDARNLSLTGAWAIYAVIGLVIGIWRRWRWVRIGSLGLLAITIIKVFTYDVFQLETNYRIIAFIGLGVLLLTSAYLYQRYRKAIKGIFTK